MYKLNLKEIPQDGRTYRFTRQTGEITSEIADLIGKNDFQMDFTIRPMGNIYEIRGTMRTGVEQVCAKCGWDLKTPMEKTFLEYLVADGDHPRGSRSVHGNQSLDLEGDGPGYTFYQGEHFLVGEYFHEMIAINEAFYPDCGKTDCEHLLEMQRILAGLQAGEDPTPVKVQPFQALKGLRLKNQ